MDTLDHRDPNSPPEHPRTRRTLIALAPLLVLAACSSPSPPAVEEPPSQLTLAPCTFPGLDEELQCGKLAVWENREARSGRKIELNVVVAPATGENPAPDPVFYFEGGPGGAAADQPAGLAQALASVRQRRDLVMVDQRGTGASHPLDCPIPGGPDDIQGYFGDYMPVDVMTACRDELSKDADLALYTTSIAMDDIEEVRQALGYGKINLLGGSYGTRAAQVYMRRHPDSVRTAILEGVAGMEQYLPMYHAPDAQRALDLIFAACEAEAGCAAAFPRLREEFAAVIERLEAAPARVEIPHPTTGAPVEITFSREALAEGFRFLNYAPATAVTLPLAIHLAYEGDYRLPARLVLLWQMQIRSILSFGMHLSVICAEDIPFFTAEEAAAKAEGTFLGDFRVRQARAACAVWPRGEIPADYHEAVTVAVPTLVLTGEYDPVTPPYWGEEVAAHLPDHLHLNLADGHHSYSGLSNQECLEDLQLRFLEQGSLDGLDATCIETMKRGPFLTDPAQIDALLAQFDGGGQPAQEEEGEKGDEGKEEAAQKEAA